MTCYSYALWYSGPSKESTFQFFTLTLVQKCCSCCAKAEKIETRCYHIIHSWLTAGMILKCRILRCYTAEVVKEADRGLSQHCNPAYWLYPVKAGVLSSRNHFTFRLPLVWTLQSASIRSASFWWWSYMDYLANRFTAVLKYESPYHCLAASLSGCYCWFHLCTCRYFLSPSGSSCRYFLSPSGSSSLLV